MSDSIPRFGANEFYLVETDALALREQLRSALSEVLGRPVLDSDPHMVLASAFLPFMVQGQASADAAAKATLRAFAVGADLDRIADSTCVVGYLDRMPARPAVLAYIIGVEIARPSGAVAGYVDIQWEAERPFGDVRFAGKGSFRIAYDAGVLSRSLSLPVYLEASETGSALNGSLPVSGTALAVDDEVSITISAVSEGDDCTVESPVAYRCGSAYNGADAEGDADFAARCAWQAKSLRVPGSYEYFRLLLSPLYRMASYYVAPQADDDGRIVMAYCDKAAAYAAYNRVTLSDKGEAYAELVRVVQASLLVEQRVMLYPARRVATAYAVSYYTPSGVSDVASARSAIESAWTKYVANHAWHCGALISRSDIMAALEAAGAAAVTITTAAGAYALLSADAAIIDAGFSISYAGSVAGYEPPEGGDGEEITP